jgi:branched-chain amino acid transport system permease protein
MKMNSRQLRSVLKYVPFLFFVVLIFLPSFVSTYYVSLVTSVLIWVGLAVSWWFFSGTTKYVSLGSAAFFGVGVYVTAVFSGSLPFPAIVLLAAAICFLFAAGVGTVTLRLRGVYFAILTFGLAELLSNANLFYEMRVTGTRGRFIPTMDVFYPILLITFVIVVFVVLTRRTKLGLGLRMIGQSEEAAIHFGVNTTLYKVLGFAVSSMFMGALGAAIAPRWGYIDSGIAFNSLYSFMPAIMTLFGGTGMIFGPILGAVVIALLQEYLLTTLKDYFMIILGAIMIIVILGLPGGLTGWLRQKRAAKVSQDSVPAAGDGT